MIPDAAFWAVGLMLVCGLLVCGLVVADNLVGLLLSGRVYSSMCFGGMLVCAGVYVWCLFRLFVRVWRFVLFGCG